MRDGGADCGRPGLARVMQNQVRFNVFLRKQEDGLQLTVNTRFREQRRFDGNYLWVACSSTGKVERVLHKKSGLAPAN